MTATGHTLHRHRHHFGWDNGEPPVLTVAPGETVSFETAEASGGQLSAASSAADLNDLDFDRVNPVTGPVFVDGAKPGDALKVTILSMTATDWGWTAVIPGFGLLADQFPDPALHMWSLKDRSSGRADFGPGGRVPLKPMCGTIGLAPAEPGRHSVVPPRRVGGNMDIRDIGEGCVLYLPVEVDGALFSVGDTHGAQGDGEVCGTAIESPMEVALKLEVVKGAAIDFPSFETPGPVSRHLDAKGYWVTTGVGPNLMEGARAAVSQMIDRLGRDHGMTPADAYMLCSVCADLRISEIVDVPNWVVSLYFPRIVFD